MKKNRFWQWTYLISGLCAATFMILLCVLLYGDALDAQVSFISEMDKLMKGFAIGCVAVVGLEFLVAITIGWKWTRQCRVILAIFDSICIVGLSILSFYLFKFVIKTDLLPAEGLWFTDIAAVFTLVFTFVAFVLDVAYLAVNRKK